MSILAKILAFIGPVADAARGKVNSTELFHAIVSALVAGGGVVGVLAAIQSGAGVIFFDPANASLAAMAATVALDLIRRAGHGTDAK